MKNQTLHERQRKETAHFKASGKPPPWPAAKPPLQSPLPPPHSHPLPAHARCQPTLGCRGNAVGRLQVGTNGHSVLGLTKPHADRGSERETVFDLPQKTNFTSFFYVKEWFRACCEKSHDEGKRKQTNPTTKQPLLPPLLKIAPRLKTGSRNKGKFCERRFDDTKKRPIFVEKEPLKILQCRKTFYCKY